MLIWKIFVIIMFVTSLIFVNVNSSDDQPPSGSSRRSRRYFLNSGSSDVPTHASTPRLPRLGRSSGNVNPSGLPPLPSSQRQPRGGNIIENPSAAPSSSRRARQVQRGSSSANANDDDDDDDESFDTRRPILGPISLYNQERRMTYQLVHNIYNPFPIGDLQSTCYSQIRVFCDNNRNELESNHCIKRAILFYKNNLLIRDERGRLEYFSRSVRTYFSTFPLYAENVPFPFSFCRQKGIKAIQRSSEYQAIAHDQDALNGRLTMFVNWCLEVLKEYQDFVPQQTPITQTDKSRARYNIAYYALNFKTTLGMQGEELTTMEPERTYADDLTYIYGYVPESLEYSYISVISNHVTSNDGMNQNLVTMNYNK